MKTAFKVIVIGGGHAGVEAAWAAANVLGLAEDGSATVALVTQDPEKIGVMSCNPAIGGLAKGQIVREIDALNGLMGLATDATGIQFKVLNTSKGPAVHGPRAQCDKHAYARAVQGMIAGRAEICVVAGSVEGLVVEGGEVRGVRVLGKGRGLKAQSSKAQSSNGQSSKAQSSNGQSSKAQSSNGQSTKAQSSDGQSSNQQSSRGDDSAGDLRFEVLSFELSADAVVLTTGTFMRGLMHTGERKTAGGRFGEAAAVGISGALAGLGFELGRLKTGTPPRLRRGTIRWEELPEQLGDERAVAFSDLSGMLSEEEEGGERLGAASLSRFPVLRQTDCRITTTSAAVHRIIRENLHRAPMYSGQIESVGPRYCPSLEDKVVRFAERESHQVFLEPESLSDDWVYCNGISTSLPVDVQDRIVRLLPGCEGAEILRYGYAVEYDMVKPHQIYATCETRGVRGLFLAGQINGTSGYEEAAGQGLLAGLNAARRARGEEAAVLGREESYIGVMMDDLVTKTPTEPYRMFTSRAEHRLNLRADNAADRLTPVAERVGLMRHGDLSRLRAGRFERRSRLLRELGELIDRTRVGEKTLAELCRRPEFTVEELMRYVGGAGRDWPTEVVFTAHTDRFYQHYLRKSREQMTLQDDLERRGIPAEIEYERLVHLRAEARQALMKFRPVTLAQASRLEGMTPADVTLLGVLVKKWRQEQGRRTGGEPPVPSR
ncbi:MAG: tRNA uridine-5-carboxymethylaminomethyl(34) synthesis enzyme MnmG [Phycisphaerales bacterium]|nr:tRNA uridine-5-carboxymethylaminomethyl(34) synthesis enzyme MnmG [Phycisphaerales bacterium]